ncbi:hypothetical protein DFH29DRAFT_984805 [Suillus ampliporus]|nr:hypothetical protein DFH29DRAFT_984805 [Suillus ampliporus]
MVSCTFFACLSAYIAKGKALAGEWDTSKPFGGVNVVLVGNFHQFPPIAAGRNAPLFWPSNSSKDSAEELLGRKLYEEFSIVIRLKEQVRVTNLDCCHAHHIKLLQSLIITDPSCPPTDFATPPWNEVVLVMPRHAVHRQWNSMMAQTMSYDTFQGRSLTLSEQFTVVTKKQKKRCEKNDERAALSNKLELAIRMKVMVTFNVETDMDMANGACGEITEIVLDEPETSFLPTAPIMDLAYPPAYILIKMNCTKAVQLEGLEKNVLP